MSCRLVTSRALPDSKRPVTKKGLIPPAILEKHGLREQLNLTAEEYEALLKEFQESADALPASSMHDDFDPIPSDAEAAPARDARAAPSAAQLMAERFLPPKQLVMVFMDETYIDLSMGGGAIPVHEKEAERGRAEQEGIRNMCTKTDLGERLIVIHAFTADGFLSHPNYRGLVEEDHDDLFGTSRTLHMDNKIPTAECVWSNRVGYKDYHKALTGEDFRIWLHTRLEPAFRARYGPDAAMVLVLDSEY